MVDCCLVLVWESDDEVVVEFAASFLVWFVKLIEPEDVDGEVMLDVVVVDDEVDVCELEVWEFLSLTDWLLTILVVALIVLRELRISWILLMVASKLINLLLALYLSKIKLLLAGYTYTPTRLLAG